VASVEASTTTRKAIYALIFAVLLLGGIQLGIFLRPFATAQSYYVSQPVYALAQPANCLTVQGKLTDSAGAAITVAKTFEFSIFDQSIDGNLIWNETQSLTLTSQTGSQPAGLFFAQLGLGTCSAGSAGNPAGSQTWPLNFNQPLWLAIGIKDTLVPSRYLSPRIAITNPPYSPQRGAAPLHSSVTGSTTACSIASLSTSAGFTAPTSYTTSVSSSGTITATLNFLVLSSATSGLTSTWQFIYGTGVAPACAAIAGLGTALGQPYVLQTQAASAHEWAQSIAMTISGLIPNTAYWFDVKVTDSSIDSWQYNNQQLLITDIIASANPNQNAVEKDNANSCAHTATATTLMTGLGVTYTTLPSWLGSGTVRVTLSFELASPAISADSNSWILAYGTGVVPACNAVVTGTLIGKQYTTQSQAATVLQVEQSVAVVVQSLTANTAYWFDLQSTDISINVWTTSKPTLVIIEEPSNQAGNPQQNVIKTASQQTSSCITTTTATSMAGLREIYALTSSSSGSISGTLTVDALASGTIVAGSTATLQLAYSDITTATLPACAAVSIGTIVGNTVIIQTTGVTAFRYGVTLPFVITGLIAGHVYWFDIQVTNAGATFTSTYGLPTLVISDAQANNYPHNNLLFLAGNAPSCVSTAITAQMGGMAVVPTTANPPMWYETTSYGSQNVLIQFQFAITPTAATETRTFQLTYTAIIDPASGVAATAIPACAAATTGTLVGNSYVYSNQVATSQVGYGSITIAINGLTKGTLYWFDVTVTDSTLGQAGATPQMTIMESA
jgi:hypothetical protein